LERTISKYNKPVHPSFRTKLDASNQVGQGDFERDRNSHQSVNRDVLLSALHGAHVRRVEVRPFGKFLLTHASLLAIGADILAQNAPVLGEGTHMYNPNKKLGERLTDIPAIFLLQLAQDSVTKLVIEHMKTEFSSCKQTRNLCVIVKYFRSPTKTGELLAKNEQ
jgi:hypothetical protein